MEYGPFLVTGGAGFIGSALVRALVRDGGRVVCVDKLTYAGSRLNVAEVSDSPRFTFEQADICDAPAMARLFAEYHPVGVFRLAAESHVDRSIDGPAAFVETNVVGTYVLLEAARTYWRSLPEAARAPFRFVHISTDEVFGALGPTGAFTETTPYDPSSPYSASKAASDHFARAWHRTYGLPVVVTNCSNNYGPFQYPEKLIPATILRALAGAPLAVYGRGENVRDWLFVDDHVAALRRVMTHGTPGDTYNVGGSAERSNLEVVRTLCTILDRLVPRTDGRSYTEQISFVTDRPGHDFRYAIDASHIRDTLGWRPSVRFEEGLEATVQWYLAHRDWCDAVLAGRDAAERLGTL